MRKEARWEYDKSFPFHSDPYKCSNCGEYHSQKWAFCPDCGSEMIGEYFVCPKCGVELYEAKRVEWFNDKTEKLTSDYSFKFCPECGANMKGE